MAANRHQATRTQNSASQATIKTGNGQLYTVHASNAHAATVGTVTVEKDGATIGILRVPPSDSRAMKFDCLAFEQTMKITNSIVELDTTTEWD